MLNSDNFNFCMKNNKNPPLDHQKSTSLLWKTTIFAGFSLPVLPPVLSGLAQDVWFLSPGIGAQGGDLAAALQAGLRKDGLGILLPISRGGSTCGELWVLSCFPAKVNKKQLRTQHSLEFWGEMIKNLDIWLTWPLNNVEIPWNPLV